MRRYLVRLAACAVVVAAALAVDADFAARERAAEAPQAFRLPRELPAATLAKYGLAAQPVIDRAFVAGRFSDWRADDPARALVRGADGAWTTAFPVGPGRHPYKFVVFPRETRGLPSWSAGMIWLEDPAATMAEDDSYGGKNSVLEVPDVAPWRDMLRFAAFLVVGAIVAWTALELLVRLLLFLRISLRWKLLLVYALLLAASDLALLKLGADRRAEVAHRAAQDKIATLHAILAGSGVDLRALARPAGAARLAPAIRAALAPFFRGAAVRYDFDAFSNRGQLLDTLFVLDRDFGLVAWLQETGATRWIRAQRSSDEAVETYLRAWLGKLAERVRAAPPKPRTMATFWWNELEPDGTPDSAEHVAKTRFYRHDVFLLPIHEGGARVGWYAARLNPEAWSRLFERAFYRDLALVAALCLVFLLVVRNLAGAVLRPLGELSAWSSALAAGDLGAARAIKSGDEVESLANDVDRLRRSLADNFETLRLLHLVTGQLVRLSGEDDLFRALLVFLTANFGFRHNRAAVFLAGPADAGHPAPPLRGAYAVGCLDEAEVGERFGSLERYMQFEFGLEDFVADRAQVLAQSESRFADAVRAAAWPADSVAAAVFGDGRGRLVAAGDAPLSPAEGALRAALGLGEHLVLPLREGDALRGVLVVDQRFDRRPLAAAEADRLGILLNEFAALLATARLLSGLERAVAARTRELADKDRALFEAEKFAALGRLAAGVAHEINNPLSGLRGPLSWLERELGRLGIGGECDRDEAFRHVWSSVARIERTVRAMRALFGGGTARRERIALAPLVDAAGAALPDAARGALVFANEVAPGLRLVTDPDALAHALENLLRNAAEAGARHVTVTAEAATIRLAGAADGVSADNAAAAGAADRPDDGSPAGGPAVLSLSVRDDGPGIRPDLLPRIFEPFVTSKDPGAGGGLGLFLVRELAARGGFRVDAASEPGRGTTFTITFGRDHDG